MIDLVALRAANARRWASAKPTRDFTAIAKALVAAKPRYQVVESRTGVPWSVIAVIHQRESSQNWRCSLAQGDPWDRVSVHVPAGRGPFASWEVAAVDALTNCAPYVTRNKDWSIGSTLTLLEQYNGIGYFQRGVPSPYIWAGTDQYRSGKYVADGVYDPTHIDRQPGCAGLLKAMMALDQTVVLSGNSPKLADRSATSEVSRSPSEMTAQNPSIRQPAKGSIGAFMKAILRALFRVK